MFNVTILKMKDIIKYIVGIIITVIKQAGIILKLLKSKILLWNFISMFTVMPSTKALVRLP